ncbi:hypothetical protein V6N11_067982 [Hibiscus sabdariffa]|uniref:Retrovirus-related Pol polyprotein from transposon TNT 1-94 n=1 Tax=Hibiscus sabdariffa TaxID=183260 RepID=A0ABR2SSC5_9ROSI
MLDDVIVTPVSLDNLPRQPDALIATPIPLDDPPQQDVSPDLSQQDVSPILPQHHPLPQRVRRPNPRYFGHSFVNATTCHPLPSTLEPKNVTQALKEAEYRVVANATAEVLWVQHFLQELVVALPKPSSLFCDNLSTTYVCKNLVFTLV